MPTTSQFTAATSGTDTLDFGQMAANNGTYGQGSNDPKFVAIGGEVFQRDLGTGALSQSIDPSSVDPALRFRALPGEMDITIVS